MTLIDPRDHAGRPIHGDLARIEEENKWKQMGWDGRSADTYDAPAVVASAGPLALPSTDEATAGGRMPGRQADHYSGLV